MATNIASSDILPLSVQQAAAARQLGAFKKVYKTNSNKSIVAAIFFMAGAVFFSAGGIFPPPSALSVTTRVILLMFALLMLVLVTYLFATVIQIANRRVYLFQRGIVIEKRNQVQTLPWNQVAEIWQSITRRYRNGAYVGTSYVYTLRREDGYRIKLDNLTKDIAELGPTVAQGIAQELIPRALQSMRAGQTLGFAPFSVNQQGISNEREFIPWSQVQAIDVKQGRLTIKKTGMSRGWDTAMVAKIPNYLVFTVVAEEMRRLAGNAR